MASTIEGGCSETYDNCNCAVNCGCQFNLPSTHGYCQSAFVGNIVDGHFNDTPLAGLNWAAVYKWPGEIKEGNGKRQIIIDERADEAQRVALEAILSGGACEPLSNLFSVFASTCSESCKTLFLPIDLEANLERKGEKIMRPGKCSVRTCSMIESAQPEIQPSGRSHP